MLRVERRLRRKRVASRRADRARTMIRSASSCMRAPPIPRLDRGGIQRADAASLRPRRQSGPTAGRAQAPISTNPAAALHPCAAAARPRDRWRHRALARAIGIHDARNFPIVALSSPLVLFFEALLPLVIVGRDPERVLEILLPTFAPIRARARSDDACSGLPDGAEHTARRRAHPGEAAEEANEPRGYIDTAAHEGVDQERRCGACFKHRRTSATLRSRG